MILERATLEQAKMPELRQLMATMGGSVAATESKADVIDRLLLLAAKQPAPAKTEDEEEDDEKKPAPNTTIEQVKEVCAGYVLLGMKIYHDVEGNTFMFRVRGKDTIVRDTNTGARTLVETWKEDSGTLRQPIATIRRCAAILMQNVKGPEKAKKGFNADNKLVDVS